MPHTGAHLLYVDDDPALVRLVEKTLGRRGFTVSHAFNREQALAMIATGGIEVVALDHHLETGTGLDVLAEMAALTNAPSVVYVTGSADMRVAVDALRAGASDFVPKTVGEDFFELLFSALVQAVEKTRLRAQKETAEREMRLARDRAELLLREVNHRVANSLSLVASLVNLQAGATSNELAKSVLNETQARILAIALVHKRLYTSGDVRFVDLGDYLAGLLDHVRSSITSGNLGATLRLNLASCHVKTDAAINLGVMVTELVTNAFKYAYPADQAGQIRVRLLRRPDGQLELCVSDDGVGWSGVGPVKGTGLGSRIIKAMAKSLDASLDYSTRDGSTTVTVLFDPGDIDVAA